MTKAPTTKPEPEEKPEKEDKGKGPEKVQTIEEQGIDPRTPYPTGGAAAEAPAAPEPDKEE